MGGVTVDLPPTDQPWGNREMYVSSGYALATGN